MAGIYIHVPFCSKRCTYCDFFSNTDMRYKETYITSAIRELELRKDYLNNELIETIYFGGGTPSQLNKQAFDRFFEAISSLFTVDKKCGNHSRGQSGRYDAGVHQGYTYITIQQG